MSSKQFSILIEGTIDAAFAVDAVGRVSAWNTAAVQLFGIAAADALGSRCHQLFECSNENGITCSDSCIIERAAQDKCPTASFELQVKTSMGRQWCNLATLIAVDASGSRHAIHIVQPREMWKRLEKALNEFVRMKGDGVATGERMISVSPLRKINVALTSREIQVLRSLANGDSTKSIANQLNISSATVNNHIKHILAKLDAHTRLEAIRYAESAGVI